MAGDTTTIRVPRATRDLLANEARERGLSLAAMLSEYAHRAARDAAFRSEREAVRADAAGADDQEWDSVAGDGVG